MHRQTRRSQQLAARLSQLRGSSGVATRRPLSLSQLRRWPCGAVQPLPAPLLSANDWVGDGGHCPPGAGSSAGRSAPVSLEICRATAVVAVQKQIQAAQAKEPVSKQSPWPLIIDRASGHSQGAWHSRQEGRSPATLMKGPLHSCGCRHLLQAGSRAAQCARRLLCVWLSSGSCPALATQLSSSAGKPPGYSRPPQTEPDRTWWSPASPAFHQRY